MKVLLIDGYNTIYKIPELESLLDYSLEEARTAVTKMAKEYQRKDGGVAQVFVVFDGKDEYRGLSFKKEGQVFSRTGQGDRKIIKMAQDKTDKFHVIVVSDDNFVGNSCRAAGATVISVKRFYEFINKH